MHVAHLTLVNFGPYRGTHHLELGPGIYAVVGRHDDDPGRSNWLGKTWLLGAIRFALFGVRPSGADTNDGWITRGEDDGAVEVVLSDGTTISRACDRGKSIRMVVGHMRPGTGVATQKAAQAKVEKLLVMDKDDFEASAWIGQKAISALVTMQAGERNKLVDGWLGLDPLREAESFAMTKVREATRDARTARTRHNALDEALSDYETPDLDLMGRSVALTEEALRKALKGAEALREWEAHAGGAAQYDRIVDEGKALKAEVNAAGDPPDVDAALDQVERLRAVAIDASAAYSSCSNLLGSPFDGRCPVSLVTCPIADEVRAGQEARAQELKTAGKANRVAEAAWAIARDTANNAQQDAKDRAVGEARLEMLRGQLDEHVEAAEFIADHSDPPEGQDLVGLRGHAHDALNELAVAEAVADAAEKDAVRVQEALEEAEAAGRQVRVWAAAARLLRGARREIAEGSLRRIECGANDTIAAAGIDLSLELRWEREGKDLAAACPECGEPISGQKHKLCPACGAVRPRKLIEELEPVLSDRSGAADDIAGLALQLSAASWLRERRGSDWGTVCIDEPFGSLDETNRLALASHLQAMLAGRFEQAFVVAHDARIMQALPARIVVRSDGKNSRLEIEG